MDDSGTHRRFNQNHFQSLPLSSGLSMVTSSQKASRSPSLQGEMSLPNPTEPTITMFRDENPTSPPSPAAVLPPRKRKYSTDEAEHQLQVNRQHNHEPPCHWPFSGWGVKQPLLKSWGGERGVGSWNLLDPQNLEFPKNLEFWIRDLQILGQKPGTWEVSELQSLLLGGHSFWNFLVYILVGGPNGPGGAT